MNWNIRYKIYPGIDSFTMIAEHPKDWHSGKNETRIPIVFNHYNHIYFVDLLDEYDRYGCYVQMRISMPDGTELIGWQSKDFVVLHHEGDAFDGRYNSYHQPKDDE